MAAALAVNVLIPCNHGTEKIRGSAPRKVPAP